MDGFLLVLILPSVDVVAGKKKKRRKSTPKRLPRIKERHSLSVGILCSTILHLQISDKREEKKFLGCNNDIKFNSCKFVLWLYFPCVVMAANGRVEEAGRTF